MKLLPTPPGVPDVYDDIYFAGRVATDRVYWEALSADETAKGYGMDPMEAITALVEALEKQVEALKTKE